LNQLIVAKPLASIKNLIKQIEWIQLYTNTSDIQIMYHIPKNKNKTYNIYCNKNHFLFHRRSISVRLCLYSANVIMQHTCIIVKLHSCAIVYVISHFVVKIFLIK
jgi:hypothetical protein